MCSFTQRDLSQYIYVCHVLFPEKERDEKEEEEEEMEEESIRRENIYTTIIMEQGTDERWQSFF